jgi:hypothetical protein
MAIEFISNVGPGQIDYSTVTNWVAACAADYKLATTKIFDFTTGGLPLLDNTVVSGLTSGASGIVMHVSNATNQAAIKNITGVFQSGEYIQDVNVDTRWGTIHDAGEGDAIPVAALASTVGLMEDNPTINGFNADKIIIRTQASDKSTSPPAGWPVIKAYGNSNNYSMWVVQDDNVYIEDLQYYAGNFNVGTRFIEIQGDNCHVKRCAFQGFNLLGAVAVMVSSGTNSEIVDCYKYNCGGDEFVEVSNSVVSNVLVANCVSVDHSTGIVQATNGQVKAINNIMYDSTATEDYDSTYTWDTGTSYNFSYDDTAPGSNSIWGNSQSKTPDFVDSAGGNMHLEDTSDARSAGVGPAIDSDVPLNAFDNETRSGPTTDMGIDLTTQIAGAGEMFMLF